MFDTSVTPPTVEPSTGRAARRPPPLYVWGLAGLACVLALVATSRGPGLDPDSVVYLSTGQSLAHGDGLVDLTGERLTVFPPGVPAIAALGELAGASGEGTVRWLNAGCAAAIVVLGHLLLRRLGPRPGILVGATALLVVAPALTGVTRTASSEAAFVVVTLVFLLLLGSVWGGRRLSVARLVSLAVLCWLAFLLRYAGGALIVAGALGLAAGMWPLGRRAVLKVLTFCVLAVSIPVTWVIRNHEVDGTLLGPRVPSPDSVGDVAARVGGTMGRWVLGGGTQSAATIAVGAAAIATVAIALYAALSPLRSKAHVRRQVYAGLAPSAIFCIVYLGYIAAAQLSTGIDPIDHRLLCPVYVPMLLLGTNAVNVGLDRWGQMSVSSRGRLEIAAVGLLLVGGQLAFSVRGARAGAVDGIGFNARTTQESELGRAARAAALQSDADLYTNSVEDLWSATGLQPLHRAPAFAGIRDVALLGQREAFAGTVACSAAPVLLAMYTEGDPKIYSTESIAEAVHLEVEMRFGDGTLYRVSPLPGSAPARCEGR